MVSIPDRRRTRPPWCRSTPLPAGGGGEDAQVSARPVLPSFTPAQYEELERQKGIYKYLVAGVPVPPDLVPISSGIDTRLTLGVYFDPEPGRCRRTNGKKWRCSKAVAPDSNSKYCEHHVYHGCNRSRMSVEMQPQPAAATALPLVSGSTGGGGGASNISTPLFSSSMGSSQLHMDNAALGAGTTKDLSGSLKRPLQPGPNKSLKRRSVLSLTTGTPVPTGAVPDASTEVPGGGQPLSGLQEEPVFLADPAGATTQEDSLVEQPTEVTAQEEASAVEQPGEDAGRMAIPEQPQIVLSLSLGMPSSEAALEPGDSFAALSGVMVTGVGASASDVALGDVGGATLAEDWLLESMDHARRSVVTMDPAMMSQLRCMVEGTLEKSMFLHQQKDWDRLIAEAASLRAREEEACQRAERLEKECDEARGQAAILQFQVADEQKRREEAERRTLEKSMFLHQQKDWDRLTAKAASLGAREEEARHRAERLEKECDEARGQVAVLQFQVADEQKRREEAERRTLEKSMFLHQQKDWDRMTAEAASLRSREEEARHHAERLEKECDEARGRAAVLQFQVADEQKRREEAERVVGRGKAQIRSLESEVADQRREIEELRSTTDGFQVKLSQVEEHLFEAQERDAVLNGEVAGLRVSYQEAVSGAKEARDQLLALAERARKEESELAAVRRELNQALGERDDARQECVNVRRDLDIVVDNVEAMVDHEEAISRSASRLAEENRQLRAEVHSLRAAANQACERAVSRGQEVEGLRKRLAEVGAELSTAQGALAVEQRDHLELQIVVRSLCDPLELQTMVRSLCDPIRSWRAVPEASSLRSCLVAAFELAIMDGYLIGAGRVPYASAVRITRRST